MWEDLYDCKCYHMLVAVMCTDNRSVGITGLSKSEASKLLNSILSAPNDSDTYVVQLNVFHLLHWVNLLRKAIYKDEYPGWQYNENGAVNHDTILGYHWGMFAYLSPRAYSDLWNQITILTHSGSPSCVMLT